MSFLCLTSIRFFGYCICRRQALDIRRLPEQFAGTGAWIITVIPAADSARSAVLNGEVSLGLVRRAATEATSALNAIRHRQLVVGLEHMDAIREVDPLYEHLCQSGAILKDLQDAAASAERMPFAPQVSNT